MPSVRTSTFTSGSGLTFTDMNALADAWNTYTPTVSGWTLGNGTVAGRYLQFGYLIGATIDLTVGATTTVAGSYLGLTLPFALRSAGRSARVVAEIGSGFYQMAGIGWGTDLRVYALGTSGQMVAPTSTVPASWATGDEVHVEAWFEANTIS